MFGFEVSDGVCGLFERESAVDHWCELSCGDLVPIRCNSSVSGAPWGEDAGARPAGGQLGRDEQLERSQDAAVAGYSASGKDERSIGSHQSAQLAQAGFWLDRIDT